MIQHKLLRLFSACVAAVLVCCTVCRVAALPSDGWQEQYSETKLHLQTLTPQIGSVGGEWLVLGLARSGAFNGEKRAEYLEKAAAYVQAVGSDRLHRHKSSDNSRLIVALSAAGKDARAIGGYDITAPLNDFAYVSRQGLNGVIWALIALDTCDYPCQAGVREQLLEALLTAQHSDGGWGLDETVTDPDLTCMAIQALAPYRFYDTAMQRAINSALSWLAEKQGANGTLYDAFSPESCAQMIVALSTLGVDCQDDSRFCVKSKTVLDSLMQYAVDGGFAHTIGMEYNQMATEQAFYAMTAYKRWTAHASALYDMRDVQSFTVPDADGNGAVTINDATYLQRFIAEYAVSLTVPQQRLCNLSHSGKININDVTLLQRLLAQ